MSLPIDQPVILDQTSLRSIHFFESLASTNDQAKQLPHSAKLPALIIATEQRSGRGQKDNVWWSAPGSLTLSWVVELNESSPVSLSALASGVAVANAIRLTDKGLVPKCKWPNDIYLDNKKVAGILVESIFQNENRRLIVGIGINSNCDMTAAPETIQQRATSLKNHLNGIVDQQSLIIHLVNELDAQFALMESDPGKLLREYNSASIFHLDQPIQLTTGAGEKLAGNFIGFGSHGELILRVGSQTRKIFSATIEEF